MEMHWESDISENSIKRYTRQIIVPNVGIEGQKLIENSRILIVGLGGLGSPVLAYIGMAGVNQIGVVDFDSVELHNLQRQLAHTENRIGTSKVKSGTRFMKELNSSVKIIPHDILMDNTNCSDIIYEYDIVIDCCDRIDLRYAIADACRDLGKSLVNGSVLRWGGQICIFPSGGGCFRCVFPDMKSEGRNCDESGVIGSMCGVVGSMQATEAIKLALGEVNKSKMIIFNGYNNSYKCFEFNCKPCKLCIEMNNKSNEKSNDKSNEKSNDKSNKSNEKSNDKSNEKSNDKSNNIIEKNDKSNNIIEKSNEKSNNIIEKNDKSNNIIEKSNNIIEKSNEKSNNIIEKSNEKSNNIIEKSNNIIEKSNNIIEKNDKSNIVNKNNIITWRCILKNPSQFKIYDIRSELHFKMFRVKNSINLDYDVDKFVHNGPETIVISCYRGIGSKKVVDSLRRKGIEAFSAEDGIEGFKKESNF